MSEPVELHNAWTWDCPECGRENFDRAVTADMTRAESIDYARKLGRIDYGFEPSEDFNCEFMTQPETVVCAHCEREFDVARFDESEDDE